MLQYLRKRHILEGKYCRLVGGNQLFHMMVQFWRAAMVVFNTYLQKRSYLSFVESTVGVGECLTC